MIFSTLEFIINKTYWKPGNEIKRERGSVLLFCEKEFKNDKVSLLKKKLLFCFLVLAKLSFQVEALSVGLVDGICAIFLRLNDNLS